MWWTLQPIVFYCDALARLFHASPQAALSGQRIWKFVVLEKTYFWCESWLIGLLLLCLLLAQTFHSLPGLPFGTAPAKRIPWSFPPLSGYQWGLRGWSVFGSHMMVENDNWLNSLQVQHSWFFNVHVAHSGLKVLLEFAFFKAGVLMIRGIQVFTCL